MIASGCHSKQYKEYKEACFASACSWCFVLVCDSTIFYNSTNQWGSLGYFSLR